MTLARRLSTFRAASKAAVHKTLRGRGWELRRAPAPLLERPDAYLHLDLEHLIALRMVEDREMFVVQIGAFDGRTGDQLHQWIARFGWRGILVEPQPHYFEALQRTYADHPELTLRNVAISEKREIRTLFTIRPGVPGLPEWAPQVASFDRALVDRHGLLGPGGENILEAHPVECVPLSELLDGVERIDLLQIDVEGYDAEIIRMFDFDRWRPSIVRFEHFHLSRRDHAATVKRLLEHGYAIAIAGFDTLAWHRT